DEPRWEVATDDGTTRSFDAVVVANGHQWQPLHDPGLRAEFTGEYFHSHDYKEPEPFIGKRVCIVGIGNSAVDIATDLCPIAKRAVVVARSGVLILPKTVFGIPITDIIARLYRWWIPPSIPGRVAKAITYIVHGDMAKYGFKPLTRRTHATSGALICHHIAYNRLAVKSGIEAVDGRTIRFRDGTSEEFDAMIAATGYRIEFPFIAPEIMQVQQNRVALYKRIVPPRWPGLYFIGLINTNTALPMIFENQARWIMEFALGRAVLPSREEMEADIEARDRWLAQTYPESPRHTIETEFFPYFEELRVSRKEGQKRTFRLGAGQSVWVMR
ncbi:MAG: flavin-containing monooxygenase, partial [Vulcanimicrobiaceae bacterium]